MDWAQLLTIVGANLAMFMWARSEARQDLSELRNINQSIQEEIKDFHARLCVIEKNRKK